MLFKNEDESERRSFSIVLDSVSDDRDLIQEQLQLDLSEEADGKILVDREIKTNVDHGMIFKKVADVGQ